jgi:hypothetical protein
MDRAEISAGLLALAASRADGAGRAWLDAAARGRPDQLPRAFAEAGRRVGRAPLAATREEAAALSAHGLEWSLEDWSVDDAARAGLLAAFGARLKEPRLDVLVAALWRSGATRERAALVRALPLLPGPSRFLTAARAAARSEVRPLFLAAARDNPYPALHFPEEALLRLAARARALGVPGDRLLGVQRRLTRGLEGA